MEHDKEPYWYVFTSSNGTELDILQQAVLYEVFRTA